MTDKELLELAAKAAGMVGYKWCDLALFPVQGLKCGRIPYEPMWNPLTDDGDAFRLAVKLNLLIDCASHCARPIPDGIPWQDGNDLDPYAATRRAIVRAAAELAKQEGKV